MQVVNNASDLLVSLPIRTRESSFNMQNVHYIWLANHKASFNSFDKRNTTELSKYVWELKNQNIDYTLIKWKLLKQAKPYNCASNRCNLCLWEKYIIICKRKMATLNKRNDNSLFHPYRNRQVVLSIRMKQTVVVF